MLKGPFCRAFASSARRIDALNVFVVLLFLWHSMCVYMIKMINLMRLMRLTGLTGFTEKVRPKEIKLKANI